MKQLLWIMTILLLNSTSQALVTDKFRCNLQIKDYLTQAHTETEKEFFLARLPLSSGPFPDIRMTASDGSESLSLETKNAKMTATMNFYYKHALKIDSVGKPIQASQITCLGLGVSYCDKSSSSNNGDLVSSCSHSMMACFEPNDPFASTDGWSPVSLRGDVPDFEAKALGPMISNINNNSGLTIGDAVIGCQHLGTFQ